MVGAFSISKPFLIPDPDVLSFSLSKHWAHGLRFITLAPQQTSTPGRKGDGGVSWFSSLKGPGLSPPLFSAREPLLQMLFYGYSWLEGKHSTIYTVRPESG